MSYCNLLESQTDLQLVSFLNVFWIVLKISFSYSLPVVNMRLIGRKFWGKFRSLPDVGKVMILPPSKLLGSAQAEGSD
jgi:hypothetical protein